MSKYRLPSGAVVVATPMTHKATGQRFIRDEEGKLWPLEVCQPQPDDDDDPGARDPITPRQWAALTTCARELGLSGPEFQTLVAQVLGCQPDQVRGSLLNNGHFLAVIEKLEEIPPPPP